MKLEEALQLCPVVAILRGVRPDEVLDHAAALYEAGVRIVEVPLNSPKPLESIERVATSFGGRMVIGAGTVLTAQAVDDVAGVGGQLIVAPNTAPEVIAQATLRGLVAAPGFATATEAFTAHGCGARHLKLFPAVAFGPSYLAQLMAVLPADATIWAVGGVAPPGMAEWWKAGARAFGVGGDLYRPGQTAEETVRRAAAGVKAANSAKVSPSVS